MDKQLSLEEIKQCEYAILKDVADFCDLNGVHYCLIFGTLLGAIRHNGFIPWDDDIDIAIPREEYEWFISNYRHQKYRAIDSSIDPDYPYAFGKVMDTTTIVVEQSNLNFPIGIYIDVFPIDGLPNDIKAAQRHRKNCENACRLAIYKNISFKYPTDLLHKIFHMTCKAVSVFKSQTKIVKKQIKLAKKYSFYDSNFSSMLTIRLGCKTVLPKEVYLDLSKHTFEGGEFNIPTNYDMFLSMTYGDYMTPPPQEKQFAHFLQAYRK